MLHEIQKELKAPKWQFNAFGKYKYRSCEDILEAVKPLLKESTILLSDEIVEVGGRVYVKSTATYKSKTEDVSVSAFARESETKKGMDDSQITGTASSYARKYALNGLLLIDDQKDADTQDNTKKEVVDNKDWITPEVCNTLIDKIVSWEVQTSNVDDALKMARVKYKVSKANAELIQKLYSEKIL